MRVTGATLVRVYYLYNPMSTAVSAHVSLTRKLLTLVKRALVIWKMWESLYKRKLEKIKIFSRGSRCYSGNYLLVIDGVLIDRRSAAGQTRPRWGGGSCILTKLLRRKHYSNDNECQWAILHTLWIDIYYMARCAHQHSATNEEPVGGEGSKPHYECYQFCF